MTVTCDVETPFGVCDLLATSRCATDGSALCSEHAVAHDCAPCAGRTPSRVA